MKPSWSYVVVGELLEEVTPANPPGPSITPALCWGALHHGLGLARTAAPPGSGVGTWTPCKNRNLAVGRGHGGGAGHVALGTTVAPPQKMGPGTALGVTGTPRAGWPRGVILQQDEGLVEEERRLLTHHPCPSRHVVRVSEPCFPLSGPWLGAGVQRGASWRPCLPPATPREGAEQPEHSLGQCARENFLVSWGQA